MTPLLFRFAMNSTLILLVLLFVISLCEHQLGFAISLAIVISIIGGIAAAVYEKLP